MKDTPYTEAHRFRDILVAIWQAGKMKDHPFQFSNEKRTVTMSVESGEVEIMMKGRSLGEVSDFQDVFRMSAQLLKLDNDSRLDARIVTSISTVLAFPAKDA